MLNRILGTPALLEPALMSQAAFKAKTEEDSRRFGAIDREGRIVGD